MGLGAYVRCRCWQDGLATPPFDAPVVIDDEGYLDIEVPWEGNQDLYSAFLEWQAHGCPHKEMEAASEHIANWSGYRRFTDALERVGWEHFPMLWVELPESNGGNVPAPAAADALVELSRFAELPSIGTNARLVDEDTGAQLWSSVPSYDGVFAMGPDYSMGVDLDGFFVRESAGEVFRANRFRQRDVDGGVEFDDGTRRVVVSRQPLSADLEVVPDRLAVIVGDELPSDYDYIVGPLTRIFRASVETGNPVMWC